MRMIVRGHELLDDVDPANHPTILKVIPNARFIIAVKALDYSRLLVAFICKVLDVLTYHHRNNSRVNKLFSLVGIKSIWVT